MGSEEWGVYIPFTLHSTLPTLHFDCAFFELDDFGRFGDAKHLLQQLKPKDLRLLFLVSARRPRLGKPLCTTHSDRFAAHCVRMIHTLLILLRHGAYYSIFNRITAKIPHFSKIRTLYGRF